MLSQLVGTEHSKAMRPGHTPDASHQQKRQSTPNSVHGCTSYTSSSCTAAPGLTSDLPNQRKLLLKQQKQLRRTWGNSTLGHQLTM
jgi:hypothetical protein